MCAHRGPFKIKTSCAQFVFAFPLLAIFVAALPVNPSIETNPQSSKTTKTWPITYQSRVSNVFEIVANCIRVGEETSSSSKAVTVVALLLAMSMGLGCR